MIRITTAENWTGMQITDANGNPAVDAECGMANSMAFSEATDMSNKATLAVYQHYNPTDLKLVKHNAETTNVGGLTFFAQEKGTRNLQVRINGNRETQIADHSSEIKNLFLHEKKHYNDYKA